MIELVEFMLPPLPRTRLLCETPAQTTATRKGAISNASGNELGEELRLDRAVPSTIAASMT